MSEDPALLSADRQGVQTPTLNRPQRKNALNRARWIALRDALRAVVDAGWLLVLSCDLVVGSSPSVACRSIWAVPGCCRN